MFFLNIRCAGKTRSFLSLVGEWFWAVATGSKVVVVVLVVILALGNAYLYFELADARSRLEQYVNRYAELSKEYSTLYSAHTSLQHRYSELLAEYDKLLQVKGELEAEVSRLSSTIATLTSENSALRQQVAGLQEENAKLMKRVFELSNENALLTQQVAELKGEVVALMQEVAKLQEENTALQQQVSELYNENTLLKQQVGSLQNENLALKQELAKLQEANTVLRAQLESAQQEIASLKQQLDTYRSENSELMKLLSHAQEQVRALSERVSLLEAALLSLNATLANFATELLQYATLPHGFKRTLTIAEIDRIAPYMHEVQLYSDDPWRSFNNIYSYVVNKIRYSRDQWIPIPVSAICKLVAGLRVCEYQLKPFRQVVQTPYETLVRGEGDCEDQAILLYAMIQYYFRYVHKKSYTMWIALITLGDGSRHAAVFIPVEGGELAILDPAGRYKTSTWGYIAHRPALDELRSYSAHWSANGGVKWIELYYVNIATGDYVLSAEGDIYAIANYIAK